MHKFSSTCSACILATPSVPDNWSSTSQHPGKHYTKQNLTVNEETLKADGKFVCLGSMMSISRDVWIDGKIVLKIWKASAAFDNPREKVWERKHFSIQLKLKVYKGEVLSSLLYPCETWPVYSHQVDTEWIPHNSITNQCQFLLTYWNWIWPHKKYKHICAVWTDILLLLSLYSCNMLLQMHPQALITSAIQGYKF